MKNNTYSDHLVKILKELGYTHCFFVAGGNIMHLLNSARENFVCIPFVHEVSAGIAAEYFTELGSSSNKKAFVMVTAGPGLSNLITSIAGAWYESRELLVIAGQVKSSDLRNGKLRQRGIQEIDGIELVKSITKMRKRISKPISDQEFVDIIHVGTSGRKGPVFFEICIDTQGIQVSNINTNFTKNFLDNYEPKVSKKVSKVIHLLQKSKRPILLIGGGVSYDFMKSAQIKIEELNIPVMTTWNGADRIDSTKLNYLGRPNTWGQRSANIIIQQSDLIIAIGSSLGLQQTGFNWCEFGKQAKIVHVDIDKHQLNNFHPHKDLRILSKSEVFINDFLFQIENQNISFNFRDWINYGKSIRNLLSLSDPRNITGNAYVNPYEFVIAQNNSMHKDAIMIPSSSGGAETVTMQTFEPVHSQRILGNKSLASMGYGLAGAIGASLAYPDRQVVLNEGDGGFSQNLQELGTLKQNWCNLKIFIWNNNGYASIKMTQQNYFNGASIGCDAETGLGLPDWEKLTKSYNIPYRLFDANIINDYKNYFNEIFSLNGPMLIEVPIDPEQTYYPKISSRVMNTGQIVSNPLHLMTPNLEDEVADKVFKYIEMRSIDE